MPDTPRPPAGQLLDPQLYAAARARWPGHPVTTEMCHDAARLEGRSPFIPATSQAVTAGLAELDRERRRHTAQVATTRAYERMNFDPTATYHKKG